MIKINIPNIRQKKQEYIDLLKPLVLLEIKLLIKSLSHLNGSVIDFTDGHFAKIKGKQTVLLN